LRDGDEGQPANAPSSIQISSVSWNEDCIPNCRGIQSEAFGRKEPSPPRIRKNRRSAEKKQGEERGVSMCSKKGFQYFVIVLFITVLLGGLSSRALADMSMTEANRPYSVRFQDWVFIYLNNEFMTAAPSAPDYNISVKPEILNNQIKFIVTGYYFDTKVGIDWYKRYASQLESTIAMLCHSWTQQGHPASLDDFEITIRKEKVNQ
jgi:hypothetical protein